MEGAGNRKMLEDFAVVSGLIWAQFLCAGNSVLLNYLMDLGLRPLTIVIFSTFATSLILCPLSIYFERKIWPQKFNLNLLMRMVLLAFAGVTLFQTVFLKGLKLTSPAMATAMPNLCPGLVFIIAAAFRLEEVQLDCIYSKVKIAGTLLCVIGAVTMSLLQSTTQNSMEKDNLLVKSPPEADIGLDASKILGCLYLMVAVSLLSGTLVLQASTLGQFPAPVSLCAITALMGGFITGGLELLQNHKLETGLALVSALDLIGLYMLGGAINGGLVSINAWASKKRGPVLVSMFTPIATVIAAILSFITLGETVSIGSLSGMLLMFTGLYFFLWAKGKEAFPIGDSKATAGEHDVEKPLLS